MRPILSIGFLYARLIFFSYMIIFLFGEDSYRLKERLDEFVSGFARKYDPAGLNLIRLDGNSAEGGKTAEALRSVGFLSSKRMVIIDGLFAVGRAAEFAEIFKDPDKTIGDNILILREQASRDELEKNKEFEILSSAGTRFEEFVPLSGGGLASWVRNKVKKMGNAIDNDAAAALIARIGSDLWAMSAELEKLGSFVPGGLITKSIVDNLLRTSAEDNIFEFLDAIAARDGKSASLILERELKANGPQFLISMLMKQFRNFILAFDLKETNSVLTESYVSKELGIHPFIAKKTIKSLQKFQRGEINVFWDNILEIDKKIKSGFKKPEALFNLFVAKIIKIEIKK